MKLIRIKKKNNKKATSSRLFAGHYAFVFVSGLIVGSLLISILQIRNSSSFALFENISSWKEIGSSVESLSSSLPSTILQERQRKETTTTTMTLTRGQRIVQNAFNSTFQYLIEYCPDPGSDYFYSTEKQQHQKWGDFKVCLQRMYDDLVLRNGTSSLPSENMPWWFITMIRDAANPSTGLYGSWHFIQHAPDIDQCLVEKAGTKQWRQVKCQQRFNWTKSVIPSQDCYRNTTYDPRYQRKDLPTVRQADHFTFIRDPLDRYLSGFLDKCVIGTRYIGEGHCEPSSIFQEEHLIFKRLKDKSQIRKHLNETFVSDFRLKVKDPTKRILFDTYVNSGPLQWNLHFLPLSFFCGGLYNNIQHYKFVGSMGPTFYGELDRLIQLYPSIKDAVDLVFQLDEKRSSNFSSAETKNVGVETQAATKTGLYYTPQLVKKVLEYTSIDYVMLGISIPQWAEDMLLQLDEEDLLL